MNLPLLCAHPASATVCCPHRSVSDKSCRAGQVNCLITQTLLGVLRHQKEVPELELVFFSKEQISMLYLYSILHDFGALKVLFPLRKPEKVETKRILQKNSDLQNRFFFQKHPHIKICLTNKMQPQMNFHVATRCKLRTKDGALILDVGTLQQIFLLLCFMK